MPHNTHPPQTAYPLIGAVRLLRSVLAVAGLGWALAATPAERTLYKSVLPSDRGVYSDAPDPQARRHEKISVEVHPPDTAQPASQPACLPACLRACVRACVDRTLKRDGVGT